MAYKSLVLDNSTPPFARKIILRVEERQFSFVHAMFGIRPKDDNLTVGYNFAIAQVLMSVIGGISATLYEPEWKRMDRERFTGVLKDYYPLDQEPKGVQPENTATSIYEVFRNPLVHDLGLDIKNKRKGNKLILKRLAPPNQEEGFSELFIETELENHDRRKGMSATLTFESGRQTLLLEALYWGVRRMIENISGDKKRMDRVTKLLVDALTSSSR